MCFHPLNTDLGKSLQLNNPFDYEPHPLCKAAADEVRCYVASIPELQADARLGKMMGVLIVEWEGTVGFLAAYSGLLDGRNDWSYFVPPVFDAQQPDGHFKTTERAISAINAQLSALDDEAQAAVLKQQRKDMSEALQLWLFRQYRLLNARGEEKDLVEIWHDYHQTPKIRKRFPLPPGGTGDCCAPKLLQYAFSHTMLPLQIAEFWMGASPKGEIRHDGQYYPACRGKCLPILTFMLQGLCDVAGLRVTRADSSLAQQLKTVYEDEALLVVEKPFGLLSVPGRIEAPSVQSILTERYGEVFMPHRLDMDTSGLMVVARSDEAYHHLQRQFFARTLFKRYVALLDGRVEGRGTISLPLRPDPMDRPRQVVDFLHGKQAVTDYQTLDTIGNRTLVALVPHTGRTHQLRVHCAHPDGLGVPILGDSLYGRKAERLCLHAAALSFDHPTDGRRLSFTSEPVFLENNS